MPPRPWTRLAAALLLVVSPALAQNRRAGKPRVVPPAKVVLEEEPEEGEAAPAPEREAEAEAEAEPEANPEVEAEGVPARKPAGTDEVIEDPEAASGATKAEGASLAAGAGGEETIVDPELGAAAGDGGSGSFGTTGDEPARWRLVLHTRWGVDTQWSLPEKEVIEGTTIGLLEVEQRVSDALLLSVGVRARHMMGRREGGQARYELDAVPTAAFADVGIGDTAHVRLGYQVISLGRFDVFSATNVLGVSDLRSGPVTMPDAGHVAQPALRLDVDPMPGLTVQAFYVPFFQPNIISVYGGDYSLYRAFARYLDAPTRAVLENGQGGSSLARISREGFRALGPDPSLHEPQGAVRVTVHGAPGELAFTYATALERTPALIVREVPTLDIRVEHGRFHVAAIDGATDIGPVQVGAELAYMVDRTLLATTSAIVPPARLPLSFSEQVDIIQVGLRGEMSPSDTLAVGAEAFVARPLAIPSTAGLGWFGFEESGWTRGLALGLQWKPVEGLALEVGGLLASGLTFVGLPRVEWEAATRLYLELGAAIVEGAAPGRFGSPTTSVGGLYDGTDQVFMGMRWLM